MKRAFFLIALSIPVFAFAGKYPHTKSESRHVFKKYFLYESAIFFNGHFVIKKTDGTKLKLKTIRADNGGVYYTPGDVCKNTNSHTTHGKK